MRGSTQLLIPIGFLCVAFGAAVVVSAQTPESATTTNVTTTPLPTAETLEERMANRHTDLEQAVRTQHSAQPRTLTEMVQTRIINLAANLSNRMDATTARLANIADRLESRAEKLQATGHNITAAERALTDARASLGIAANLLTDIDAEVIGAVTAGEPAGALTELRTTYETIAIALRQTHSGLRTTLAALRNAPLASLPDEAVEGASSSDMLIE